MKFNDMMGTQGTHHVIANRGISGQGTPQMWTDYLQNSLVPKAWDWNYLQWWDITYILWFILSTKPKIM